MAAKQWMWGDMRVCTCPRVTTMAWHCHGPGCAPWLGSLSTGHLLGI